MKRIENTQKYSQEEREKVRKDENGLRLVGNDHVGHEKGKALPKKIENR